jgi:transcriptional regulator with XRE-family HTH domain
MVEADEIRRRREDLGLSQARVAELAITTQQTVDRVESGVT